MGYYLGKNEVNYNKSLLKSILFILLYAVIFQFTYFNPVTDLLIVISTWYLMVFLVNNPGQPNSISKLDKYTTPVYVNHMFFITLYSGLTSVSSLFIINNLFFRLFKVTVVAIIGSILINKPISIIFKI